MNTADQSLVWVNRRSWWWTRSGRRWGPRPTRRQERRAGSRPPDRLCRRGPLWIYDRDRNVATRAQPGRFPARESWSRPGTRATRSSPIERCSAELLMLRLHHLTDTGRTRSCRRHAEFSDPRLVARGRQIAFQLSAGDTVAKTRSGSIRWTGGRRRAPSRRGAICPPPGGLRMGAG